MKLIYFGEDYYNRSGTMIGVLYHEDSGERSDWGKVNCRLRDGESVQIRPAFKSEHEAMEVKTAESIQRSKDAGFLNPESSK